jgi:putative Mg2+ transporter-C (MgtC) family protein
MIARPDLPELEIVLRVLMAFGCGALIGLNREFRGKAAGFRTFVLVSLGSAIIVIVMEREYGTGADAVSRVIQGVLTGIGFLGAGVIFRGNSPDQVEGLTTAAAVWVTAGLGMAAGTGQYLIAGLGAVLGLVLLALGGPFERWIVRTLKKPHKTPHKTRKAKDEPP